MKRCRLFIDEVGNDDLNPSSVNDNERYLSLTALLTRTDLYQTRFVPQLGAIKQDIFGLHATNVILHRREILRQERDFRCLKDADLRAEFDRRMLLLFRELPYLISTVVIDKKAHLELYNSWAFHPYHYCLRILVERYILWMKRREYVGDVVIEQRNRTADKKVKQAFSEIYDFGTDNISKNIVQKHLTSKEIKFVDKKENCPAMQLVDLIAYPSFKGMKFEKLDIPPQEDYGKKIVDILEQWKYARHPKTGIKDGWGKKWMPL